MINKEFNLTLIRHGQTEVNAEGDKIGQTKESKLTEFGELQAKSLKKMFDSNGTKFDMAYSSTYDRAYKTARLALPETFIYQVPELVEYNAGDWLGSKRKDIITDNVKLSMSYLDYTFQMPNGESMHQVERRASRWLEDEIMYNESLFKDISRPLEIVVFSHGMTIKCLLHYIMGFDKSFGWKISIDNTSITKLHFGPEGWWLLGLNDCSHLINKIEP